MPATSTFQKLHSRSVMSATVIEGNRFVTPAGAYALPGQGILGVSESRAAAGRAVSVITGWSALVLASGAISSGQSVGPAGDGTGRAVAGGLGAMALEAAADGELVEVMLGLAPAQVAANQALVSTPGIVARVCTIATLGAAADYVGGSALVTDLGGGAVLISNGSRWRPRDGQALLKMPNARATMTGTTEIVLLSVPLPWSAATGCLLRDGDSVQIWTPMSKSATTEAVTVRFRIGTAGTIADTQIVTSGGFVGTTNISAGVITDLLRASATTVQKAGHALPANGWIGASTTAYPAAITVTNLDSAQPILTFTAQSSAGAETVALELGARALWIASA